MTARRYFYLDPSGRPALLLRNREGWSSLMQLGGPDHGRVIGMATATLVPAAAGLATANERVDALHAEGALPPVDYGFTPTAEQRAALDLYATGESVAIEAGAGTGKTSTLVLLARSSGRRGVYVAFNKAIVKEAGEKMPGNFPASTAHALAMRAVGHRYRHRLNSPRMRSADVARGLGIDPVICTTKFGKKVLQPGFLAGLAMRSINVFCQTADPAPTAQHVPYVEGIDTPLPDGRRTYANNQEVRARLAPVLPVIWRDLSDPAGTLRFEHGHYLKMWQLEGPRIAADVILFDEAQDANPVMRAIVEAQDHAQIVWVGDSQQQIYTFTGAVNALAEVDAGHRTFLSQSFRFGAAIAAVANDLLGRLGAELRLTGNPDVASTVGPVAEPDVVLTRTNAGAMKVVLNHLRGGGRPHLVGGGDEVVRFAKAAKALQNEGWTEHPELACFTSWGEVLTYVAEDQLGHELRMLVELVEEYGADTNIDALDHAVREDEATLVVSTAHKAKGREWDSVLLHGDFPDGKDGEPEDEELRLLYVACTRARRELDLTAVGLFEDPEPAPVLPL